MLILLLTFRDTSDLNSDNMKQFITFLDSLSRDKNTVENLRLPLQSALFISPLFLLGDFQIHTSKFYSQRHQLALVRDFI